MISFTNKTTRYIGKSPPAAQAIMYCTRTMMHCACTYVSTPWMIRIFIRSYCPHANTETVPVRIQQLESISVLAKHQTVGTRNVQLSPSLLQTTFGFMARMFTIAQSQVNVNVYRTLPAKRNTVFTGRGPSYITWRKKDMQPPCTP